MIEAYSIYEAKTHFSALVKKIKQGKEIVINDRGTPVGRLIPFQKKESFKKKIKLMTAQGRIAPAKRTKIPEGIKKTGALSRFLEERE